MAQQGLKAWFEATARKLRALLPAWPPLIGFDTVDVWPERDERRWLDEEERILPYLYWPNL